MGLVIYLHIIAKCFDFLAWPLLALVYPLCASVQAIESNSNSDIMKLMTYWVIFSLISLFELASTKILQWIPFWPYMKLLAICWLVLPYFDGASYVYERLVHCHLAVFANPKAKEELLPGKEDDFHVQGDSCIKDNNGPESLNQSVLCSNLREPNCDTDVIKTSTESETSAALKNAEDQLQVNNAEPNLFSREINIPSREEKEMAATRASSLLVGSEFPESLSPKVQREWTCALCQVTTQSETTLKDHLRGKRHKINVEGLSACMMAAKSKAATVSSSSTSKKADQLRALLFSGRYKQMNMKKTHVENQHGAIWCDKCEIWCSGAVSMVSHLTGKKHLERLQESSAGSFSGDGKSETPSTV